jgi:hypothetical protein
VSIRQLRSSIIDLTNPLETWRVIAPGRAFRAHRLSKPPPEFFSTQG